MNFKKLKILRTLFRICFFLFCDFWWRFGGIKYWYYYFTAIHSHWQRDILAFQNPKNCIIKQISFQKTISRVDGDSKICNLEKHKNNIRQTSKYCTTYTTYFVKKIINFYPQFFLIKMLINILVSYSCSIICNFNFL